MANELRINGSLVYENEWEPPIELLQDLVNLRTDSNYRSKRNNFLEQRKGMVNFTTAGRDSTSEERKSYYDWDAYHKERESIAGIIEKKYPRVEARLGGQISIDIQPQGHNKSLASKWVRKNVGGKIVFVGDKCHKGGNDHDIVLDIQEHECDLYYPVKNSLETFGLLGKI
jgi:phosphomannomutase